MGDAKTSSDDDYDPYKERAQQHATTDIESMLHIIKGILGTGILAMPEVFKNAGMILGFVMTVLNGLLCTYGVHIFVKCIYMLCKRNKVAVLTYTEAMRTGFQQGPQWSQKMSNAAGRISDTFIIGYQVGVLCVYGLFVVVTLKTICDPYTKYEISLQVYLLMLVVPLVLINSLRNLKILVPFSLAANAVMVITIGMVFYFIFESPLPEFSELPLIGNLKRFPLVFGTTCFAFQSIALAITVENNMKTPKHFGGYCGIYNISLAMLLVLYVSLGFLGFWKYGDKTEPSITLNFPKNSILSQVVSILFAVSIFTSCGINGHVPVKLIWETYLLKRLEDSNCLVGWEYLLRISIVVLSLFFAASIPMIGLFMSLFGAISLSHLIFIFPGILDICVRYPSNYGRFKFYKWRDILFICYGIIGLITGCYVGVTEIVLEYMGK